MKRPFVKEIKKLLHYDEKHIIGFVYLDYDTKRVVAKIGNAKGLILDAVKILDKHGYKLVFYKDGNGPYSYTDYFVEYKDSLDMSWEDFKKAVKEDISPDDKVVYIQKDHYQIVFMDSGEVYYKSGEDAFCIATERTPEQMLKIKEGLE